MQEVVVLGAYGRVGRLCVAELVETTRARVLVAGRNIQRAEQLAASFGERARAVYCNAVDPRTLERVVPGTSALIVCCSADPLAALDTAVRARVPTVTLSPVVLDERAERELLKRAWDGQVPLVFHAGAVPGLPGVLAEYFVRRYPQLHEIRIASSGPWVGSEAARAAQKLRTAGSDAESWLRRPLRWHFPEPIGGRWVRQTACADLTGFAESHCVGQVIYLEPDGGALARGVSRIVPQRKGFALVAEAAAEREEQGPRPRVTLLANNAAHAAVAALGTLVWRLLHGHMPGGVFTPREALNPLVFLQRLEKRGVRVSLPTADA